MARSEFDAALIKAFSTTVVKPLLKVYVVLGLREPVINVSKFGVIDKSIIYLASLIKSKVGDRKVFSHVMLAHCGPVR